MLRFLQACAILKAVANLGANLCLVAASAWAVQVFFVDMLDIVNDNVAIP
ncbi:hypothetical protein AAZX31_04G226500 [Glycine max]